MIQLEVLQFLTLKGYKINPNFNSLSKTINLLGSELGNLIKEQAGNKYFKIVERKNHELNRSKVQNGCPWWSMGLKKPKVNDIQKESGNSTGRHDMELTAIA